MVAPNHECLLPTSSRLPEDFLYLRRLSPYFLHYELHLTSIQGCDEFSHLDVRELSPGGFQRFRQRLFNSAIAVRTKSHEQPSSTKPGRPPQAHLNPSTGSTQARAEAQHSIPNYQPSQSSQLGNNQSDSIIFQTHDPHYLLLCVNTKNSTVVVHIDVSSFSSDQYLFQQIRQEYRRIRDEHEWGISKTIPTCVRNALNRISARLPKLPSLPSSLRFFSMLSHALHRTRIHKVSSGDFV